MPDPNEAPGTRRVTLVDGDDNPVGEEGLLESHLLPGQMHRAFTALLLDGEGRVVLARRAPGKMLWHGAWDGTVASHPRPGEGYVEAGERRVREELGVDCELVAIGRFEYRAEFGAVGAEHEVCAALVGRLAPGAAPAPDPEEVDGLRATAAGELLAALTHEPASYCPWLYLALLCAGAPSTPPPTALEDALAPWRAAEVAGALRGSLASHVPAGGWRLLDAADGAA